jgi:hypothetical protein
MSHADLRNLTNHFQDVRLIGLRNWKAAADISPRDRGGPYLVAQEGYDPDDLRVRVDEFVLGRSGKWVSVGVYLKMPLETRRAEFVFGTAAEVVRLMQDLPSRADVLRPQTESQPMISPEQDELNAAFLASKQGPASESP